MQNKKSRLYRYTDKILKKSFFLPNITRMRLLFRFRHGYSLNLEHPRTYNEKLQWLKIHDRHKEYTNMVDKIEAKKHVASIIGEEYIIPTLAVFNNVEEIDFDILPQQFVMKCTHDSGGIVVCTDKSNLNREDAIRKMRKGLRTKYSKYNMEYPYDDVVPRIIVEPFLVDESGYELKDYKFFCFNGIAKCLFVATDRPDDTKFDFFDMEWNHLPIINGHPNNPNPIPRPQNFEKMVEIAEKLSSGIPHVRVDLYNIGGKIYFGELTFFHWGGMTKIEPLEWDYKLGDMLVLPHIEATR